MEYNTRREKLPISDYGRNIQKMVNIAKTQIEDKKERTLFCKALINTMENTQNSNKDSEETKKKLWNHLYFISGYDLDIDFPYEVEKKGLLYENASQRLSYPKKEKYNKEYGKTARNLLKKLVEETNEVKKQNSESVANHMKRSFSRVNNTFADEGSIRKLVEKISEGKVSLDEEFVFSKDVQWQKPPIRKKGKPGKKMNNNYRNKRR